MSAFESLEDVSVGRLQAAYIEYEGRNSLDIALPPRLEGLFRRYTLSWTMKKYRQHLALATAVFVLVVLPSAIKVGEVPLFISFSIALASCCAVFAGSWLVSEYYAHFFTGVGICCVCIPVMTSGIITRLYTLEYFTLPLGSSLIVGCCCVLFPFNISGSTAVAAFIVISCIVCIGVASPPDFPAMLLVSLAILYVFFACGMLSLAITLHKSLRSRFADYVLHTLLEAAEGEESARVHGMLTCVLPQPVVKRLLEGEDTVADSFSTVSVVFCELSDIFELQGVTVKTADLFSRVTGLLDDLGEEIGLTRIKLIGTTYMAVAGAPESVHDCADLALRFGLAVRPHLNDFAEEEGLPALSCAVGIATGPCVGGVLGRTQFCYDVWGDTVNLASRLESNSKMGEVTICVTTRESVTCEDLVFSARLMQLKGKGTVTAFTVSTKRARAPSAPVSHASATHRSPRHTTTTIAALFSPAPTLGAQALTVPGGVPSGSPRRSKAYIAPLPRIPVALPPIDSRAVPELSTNLAMSVESERAWDDDNSSALSIRSTAPLRERIPTEAREGGARTARSNMDTLRRRKFLWFRWFADSSTEDDFRRWAFSSQQGIILLMVFIEWGYLITFLILDDAILENSDAIARHHSLQHTVIMSTRSKALFFALRVCVIVPTLLGYTINIALEYRRGWGGHYFNVLIAWQWAVMVSFVVVEGAWVLIGGPAAIVHEGIRYVVLAFTFALHPAISFQYVLAFVETISVAFCCLLVYTHSFHLYGTVVLIIMFSSSMYAASLDSSLQSTYVDVRNAQYLVQETASRKRANESLLDHIYPEAVAASLRCGVVPAPKLHASVCILSADIVGFTKMASTMTAEEVVAVLDTLYVRFDDVVERHHTEKLKTIGDAYVAAAALNSATADDLLKCALDMVDVVEELIAARQFTAGVRFGLHCGPAVSLIAGSSKLSFEVIGPAVSIAAQVEGASESCKVVASEAFVEALSPTQRHHVLVHTWSRGQQQQTPSCPPLFEIRHRPLSSRR